MHTPSPEEEEMFKLELRLAQIEAQERARNNFLDFVRYVWPAFICGPHHRIMAEKFERLINNDLDRVIINIAPRHGKSELTSYLFLAWLMGCRPDSKIIQATHTGELAMRFGRKVRNLMDSDVYKEIFPEVTLAADSKAAGRWETSKGGEYFACLRPYSLVSTERGLVPAGQVVIGDRLLNANGSVSVKQVFNSEHKATVFVAGLDCSLDHPIWTMNRGWVFAGQVQPTDILCAESILGRMKALLRGLYGYLEHTYVPTLVWNQVSVHKPEKRKMAQLWWARNYAVRALAGVREFLGRYGGPAFAFAHGGADGQRWAVQPGELSVGNPHSAGKQQADKCAYWGEDFGGKCLGVGDYVASDPLSYENGPRSFVPTEAQEEELQTYGPPEKLGWWRRAAAFFFVQGFQTVFKPGNGTQGYLARVAWSAQKLFGLFLGVRAAGKTRIKRHGPRAFVNFLTDGDHTFFADGVLTHNCGVGGAMTGRGADFLVIDDPHSEQDALSETALGNCYDWYTAGPRQRLQPGGKILIVATRWSKVDLTGRVLQDQAKNPIADKWEVIEFPAIMPSGKPCWPEYWKIDDLLRVKAALPVSNWNAQWMQNPTAEEGAIFKREWWKVWNGSSVPKLQYVIQSYDTAYSKKETADYSAITTWGVFHPNEGDEANLILLDAKKGRWDFPELKKVAMEQYKFWDPDCVLIEAKASGISLSQELRRTGIPVINYSPGGRKAGTDKISRANSISPVFEAGFVWAPDEPWAEDLVEEMAEFPYGEHDDLTDSSVQAVIRFRQGNFLQLPSDFIEDEVGPRVYEYY